MRPIDRSPGIISEHFKGVGTVTRDMVVQRAREIAMINGRDPNHYTKDDFLEAKRELTGQPASVTESGQDEPLSTITTWDEEPGSQGHPAVKEQASDEQMLAEQLVEEGVNEAEHELMVEGSKRREEVE